MRRPPYSALAACLLVQSTSGLKSIGALFGKKAPPYGIDAIFGDRAPPYVCDGYMYNNREVSNSTVPWRGEGYPIVYEHGMDDSFTVHEDCHISYRSLEGVRSGLSYNASVFGLQQSDTYVVGARLSNVKFDSDLSPFTETVIMVAWARDYENENRRMVLLELANSKSVEKGNSSITLVGIAVANDGFSHFMDLIRHYPCIIDGFPDSYDVAVFVDRASIFTMVVTLRSHPALEQPVTWSIVETLDFSDFTEGRPTEIFGLRIAGVLETDIKNFNAIPWDPSTLHPPTETAFPCPKESGTIEAFSALLCTGLVVLSAQVLWASRQAKETHRVGNVPSAFDLLGIVSTGVQFFTIVGQAFYLLVCIHLGGEEKAYLRYFWATVWVLGIVLAYDVAVLVYFTRRYGVYLNRAQLRRHPVAYGLLGLMSVVNLELLMLFPWNYQYFPMASYLPGYPTPRMMRWCAGPTIILNFPALIIQVLTTNISSGFQSSDKVLIACTVVTAVDMLLHFFLRVYRIQEETQQSSKDLLRNDSGGETQAC